MKHTAADYENAWIKKGYVRDATGSWSKPRGVGAVAGAELQRAGTPSPDDQAPRKQSRRPSVGRRSRSPVCRVLFVTSANPSRARRLDDDNWALGIRAGLKPYRDAIARSFGVDDHQSTVEWIYKTVEAPGEEGVFVRVEAI